VEELHAAILDYLRGQRAPHGDLLPPPGSRVAIYARVAPGETGVLALVAQEARCRALARARGWAVLVAFREVGDGQGLLRARLTVLRAMLTRGEVAAVLVASPDRLAPDPALVEQLRAEWADSGVALLVAGPPAGR
jgi:DNA invertase Pin-like site-specific DNA recombinase